MKTTEFIQKYSPCNEGAEFAQQFETMAEVWAACKRPVWLFWILEKHAPLKKNQSVRLTIAFAEAAITNWKDKADQRPALAIQAAKTWLDDPTEENQAAAAAEAAEEAAAEAARAAAWAGWAADAAAAEAAARAAAWAAKSAGLAAEAAAWAAAWAAEAAARSAAEAARSAWAAAWAAAWSAEAVARAAWPAAWAAWTAESAEAAACDTIRQFIPNPFETERGGA